VVPLRVRYAEQGEVPTVGTVYFAPGDTHLIATRGRRFDLTYHRETRHVPSGDILLESMAQSYRAQAIGVVLTGMGADGAFGLRKMRDAGAITVTQDEETSVVYGMPQEAARLDAAKYILSLPEIPGALVRLAEK
jgi:chemotaxis response regulator CheB